MRIAFIALWMVASLGSCRGARAEGAPEPTPGRHAELDQYNYMTGTWTCEAKGTVEGKELRVKSTSTAAWDLDRSWVVARCEGRAAEMPGVHRCLSVYGYDPTSRMFISNGYDNMGDWTTSRSRGWEGDRQEWIGKSMVMGKEVDSRATVTRKGDRMFTVQGTEGNDKFESTCTKQ